MNSDGTPFAKYDLYNHRDDKVPELDDSALIRIYEETTAHLHSKVQEDGIPDDHTCESGNKRGWKVGDQCMALFEADGHYYPAKIISIMGNNACRVVYLGFGDSSDVVKLNELLSENEVEMPAGHAQMTNDENKKEVRAEAAHVPKLADLSISSLMYLLSDRLMAAAPNDSNDALQSTLMSWYMSGFHSGYLRAMQHLGVTSKTQEP